MSQTSEEQISSIGRVLNDPSRPLKERFRALFTLRNIGGATCIDLINRSFQDPSALLKHELAYCLGQMQDPDAIQVLIQVLEDRQQEPMVRHEAAEALGAIGEPHVLPILEKYREDPVVEVAETCELALGRIKWLQQPINADKLSQNPYLSVDPAPPSEMVDMQHLKTLLFDENAPLFDRYRAMFSLRNLRNDEAVLILGQALKKGSALYRHEIAFVLGQLQHELSVPFLKESLADERENEMVRHECAEALGAIATQDCYEILQRYLNDGKRVVKESCEIALDMCNYENSPEFQYANGVEAMS